MYGNHTFNSEAGSSQYLVTTQGIAQNSLHSRLSVVRRPHLHKPKRSLGIL